MDEALDARLDALAAQNDVSKASLIRDAVARVYGDAQPPADPLDALVGAFDGPAGESIDDVVYD